MRSQAFYSLVFSTCLVNTGLCLPGLHYHVPKRVAGNLDPSLTIHVGPVVTPGPDIKKTFERRVFLAADWLSASCDPSGCVFFDVSASSITSVNAQQLTATGNWCFGPGCVRASTLPLITATGTEGNPRSLTGTSSVTGPFNNGTGTIATPGPTATGTGHSPNSSSIETAPFGNGTDTTVTVGPPRAGPTVGTVISATVTPSGASSANTTITPASSSGPTGLGTGTGGVSANPTFGYTTRCPFANSTGTSDLQVGPTGTGIPGTAISPEGTSTTISTNRTTVSVTSYGDEQWAPWSAATVRPAETSTTTCTDERNSSDQPKKAATLETSFKSTATIIFSDTTYTVPIPASYSSDIPSPDSNEAKASSSADAVGAYPAATSGAASPAVTAGSYNGRSTLQPYYPGFTTLHSSSSSTFDAVSWSTSSCYTSTFYSRSTFSSTWSFVPTASASICYGIECNTASSCHDWMSQVPFTDANGNPYTTTRRPPYGNATASGTYQGTGTVTGGGGFYPAQTGTETVGAVTSAFTNNPWPSSLNTTRNPAAYTNTAEPISSILSPNPSRISLAPTNTAGGTPTNSANVTSFSNSQHSAASSGTANVTILYTTVSADDGPELSAYTTITFDAQSATSISVNTTTDQSPATRAALHPWIAWTATLETITTTGNAVSASATSVLHTNEGQEEVDSGILMMHNNLALDSKHKRAAVKAGRKHGKRLELEEGQDRQERKYDGLLQKKRIEWRADGNIEVRKARSPCCQGLSLYCWFVKSKVDDDC